MLRIRMSNTPSPTPQRDILESNSFLQTWQRRRCRTFFRWSFMLSVCILIPYGMLCLHRRSHLDRYTLSSQITTGLSSVSFTASNDMKTAVQRPPLVNRSILDKLRLLEHSLAAFEDEVPSETVRREFWPPEVTRLPGEDGQRRQTLSKSNRDPALDVELCNTSPCRLLLPSFIGEQESKARRHLLQLSHLAQALNRTLVLPNVGKSRMSSCSKWDFEFYYETGYFHGAVAFGAFRKWVALRETQPRAQVVEIVPTSSRSQGDESTKTVNLADLPELEHAEVTIGLSANPSKSGRSHCLQGRARNLYFGAFSPLHIHPHPDLRHTWARDEKGLLQFGRGVVAALSSSRIVEESTRREKGKLLGSGEPDVLVLSWELRRPIFYAISGIDALSYAERWTRVAQALSDRLQPFITIHWRMERVPASSLAQCVPLLISSISSLFSQHVMFGELTSVYLATDYPTEGPDKPHSGTFEVGEEHHQAMRLFEYAFQATEKLKGLKLTNLVKEVAFGDLVREDFRPENLDSGLTGIIDKLVAIRAALFISGGRGCGRVSSFTGQIVENRRQIRVSGGAHLLNVVEYFG